MRKRLSVLLSAVLAGMCNSISCVAFLSVESKVVGALLYNVGMFIICTFGFHLFTGKVCYVFDNDGAYALDLPIIWLGNLLGSFLTGTALRATRIAAISERAAALCEAKLGDNLLSIFILSVFCNILIYVAVEGYKSNPHELGKYLSIIFGVTIFIVCGFEQCVASMFYFTMAGMWSAKALLCLLVMTLGNAVGGVALPLLRKCVGTRL